ncbi:Caffeoyl-CoA O-methyltransferase [Stanieria cyanosphaera PCC 7437]|uniref:Caffeoyl-CoA O-methyltransferase n=1 Tax=Stanieria cyanosphaera (strain ATCC 29371 / PCC 7437) TaxID=111780 RepID=K9XRQ7_STAC7|nr:class I SAM-dependent methyltransferase [Stanieria cyanosphaera]AFZ35203.1 Caffeoyl-CoA O-methyltransferase [Stanieria cyanosphaera PCC 7437]
MVSAVENKKTARPVTPLGILVQQLETILKQAENEQVSAQLKVSLKQAYHLAAGIDPYLEECSSSESEALANLAQKTQAEDWSKRFDDGETVRALEQEMLSGHIEGQFLKMLIALTGAKRILEVGMFTGYSALAMAETIPEDGYVIACEVDEYVAKFAQDCFAVSPHGKKIEVRVAPALETMQQLAQAEEAFDLVFIDADKQEYIDYFNLLLDSNLLTSKGFICIDNTLLQGQPYLPKEQRSANGEAIARFNRFVAEDERVEQVLIPLRDGITIIKRK